MEYDFEKYKLEKKIVDLQAQVNSVRKTLNIIIQDNLNNVGPVWLSEQILQTLDFMERINNV